MAILEYIHSPEDLKKLPLNRLPKLAEEIREYLIDVVSEHGGHLGGNLGAVELIIALHYVFDSPRDKLIFDVGHQAYAHKILTGRKDQMPTIRQYGGLSGFLLRTESPHDIFGAGHACTSLSAALGLAIARDRQGEDYEVVAIIGDGAFTGGMAYEALNNIGKLQPDLLIVLNDNEMSIDENVGALPEYLNRLKTSRLYNRLKDDVWNLLGRLPSDALSKRARDLARRIRESLETLMVPTVLFEELGARYFGPIHGHDIPQLVRYFRRLRDIPGPKLLHVLTEKGRGYPPALENKELFHGLGPFEKGTGRPLKKPGPPSYSSVFGKTLLDLARRDPRVVGITAAMPLGTGLNHLRDERPDQYFDVGIAEQHAVTFAAGLAVGGMKPFVAIYSTFLQRAFDQVIHDVALQKLPVRFALDRGGLVGADGPTHHGVFDLSYLRMIPNMVVMAPRDEAELVRMIHTAYHYEEGPIAFRFPRGRGFGVPLPEDPEPLEIGTWETVRDGGAAVILAVGPFVAWALEVAEQLGHPDLGVVNARFIKPLDEALLRRLLKQGVRALITMEENVLAGGFGSAVLEFLAAEGARVPVLRFGLPDAFVPHGDRTLLLRDLGLLPDAMAQRIQEFLKAHAL